MWIEQEEAYETELVHAAWSRTTGAIVPSKPEPPFYPHDPEASRIIGAVVRVWREWRRRRDLRRAFRPVPPPLARTHASAWTRLRARLRTWRRDYQPIERYFVCRNGHVIRDSRSSWCWHCDEAPPDYIPPRLREPPPPTPIPSDGVPISR
jgi:hypothetical protein